MEDGTSQGLCPVLNFSLRQPCAHLVKTNNDVT